MYRAWASIDDLKAERHKKAVMSLVRSDRSVRADLVRRNVRELRRLEAEMKGSRQQIKKLLEETASSLTKGCRHRHAYGSSVAR